MTISWRRGKRLWSSTQVECCSCGREPSERRTRKSQTLLYTRLKQPPELITFHTGIDVECIELFFLFYTLLVILQKIRAGTLLDTSSFNGQDSRGRKRRRQRMSFAVDFVQADTQLFSGGPSNVLWCEPEHCVQIIQLLDEILNFLKRASMSFPFGQTRLRFRKACQLLSRTCILTRV